jgi:hypothetical protein
MRPTYDPGVAPAPGSAISRTPRQREPPVSNASTMSEGLIERGAADSLVADTYHLAMLEPPRPPEQQAPLNHVGYYGIAVLGPAGGDPVPCMRCDHPVTQHDNRGCCLVNSCTSSRCAAGGQLTASATR